jgi:hypothetical protein
MSKGDEGTKRGSERPENEPVCSFSVENGRQPRTVPTVPFSGHRKTVQPAGPHRSEKGFWKGLPCMKKIRGSDRLPEKVGGKNRLVRVGQELLSSC